MNFRYNIVVAAYTEFVYVVSRAGRQVDFSLLASLHKKQRTQIQYRLPQQYYNESSYFNT